MKRKVALLAVVSMFFTLGASAQGVENDDMYFNSKDREKLKASKASEASYSASIKKSNKNKEALPEEALNPTDSYSARNINPEYEARSNSQTAQADNQDYFDNSYQYNNASNFNNWNSNFNNWYTRPWYGGNYYDPYINSWNSPYYGSRYDSWGNPWANPYYRSGWSSSFSYHWGNSWDYGWGMNFGYGNYGYNPYNAWAGWASPYYGYGYSPWGPTYGYPTQVVVVENGYRGPVYGKRSSRSSQLSGDNGRVARSYNTRPATETTSGRPTIGGRTSSTTTNSQPDYYNRGWRNQQQRSYNSSYDNSYSNPNSGNTNSRSSWESNTRSSWNESNSGNSSRSSGVDSGRSSGSSSSGGSSGGGSSSTGSRSSGRGH